MVLSKCNKAAFLIFLGHSALTDANPREPSLLTNTAYLKANYKFGKSVDKIEEFGLKKSGFELQRLWSGTCYTAFGQYPATLKVNFLSNETLPSRYVIEINISGTGTISGPIYDYGKILAVPARSKFQEKFTDIRSGDFDVSIAKVSEILADKPELQTHVEFAIASDSDGEGELLFARVGKGINSSALPVDTLVTPALSYENLYFIFEPTPTPQPQ